MEIYINEDGTSKISGVNMDKYKNVNKEFIREEFKDIRNAFMKAGYQKLNDEYTGSFHCDDCMESNIKVSFFKRGKIIKTIQDAGQGSPMPFLWACLKMQYLPFIYKLSFEKT
ncbi:hypothetical protein GR160_03280 [Flavobacterium sp. Sd200]|uniref:hypothetical protein n=1 Tax=Flavobacterium sp. Sd200 TaxID=2692211 RepID=UPI00136D9C0B|nr:hypothetical protein [Flavobacterium sp. Sd200]MXN90238.1 hypothetical protein [Flavobacterium sp. Sd200]